MEWKTQRLLWNANECCRAARAARQAGDFPKCLEWVGIGLQYLAPVKDPVVRLARTRLIAEALSE